METPTGLRLTGLEYRRNPVGVVDAYQVTQGSSFLAALGAYYAPGLCVGIPLGFVFSLIAASP
jgi:hypothetical protein